MCWGSNRVGQLGDGTTTDRWTPTAIMTGVWNAPQVTQVTPGTGPLAGGTVVTITGTGFRAAAAVAFGGTAAASVTVVNETTIIAATPSHAAGTVDVAVLNGDGQTGTLSDGFAFFATSLAAGSGDHACTVTAAGGVKCWGRNDVGQLGDGTHDATGWTPTAVIGPGRPAWRRSRRADRPHVAR